MALVVFLIIISLIKCFKTVCEKFRLGHYLMDNQTWIPRLPARRIVAIYFVFGVIWILVSDQVVAVVANPDPAATVIQSVKGGVFVLLSGSLIFILLRYRERQLAETRTQMETKSQESQVLQRILRHNIRNDLNIISGNLDLADEAITDTKVSQRLRTAKETASDLLVMSEKVRALQGIKLDETVPEPVDVVPIINSAIEQIAQEYPSISIDADIPAECMAQAGPALKYACSEVLENSVEHYDEPIETLEISIVVEELAESIRIEIRDNGPGIPDGELDALESGQETSLAHGSGIGLWVVKWVCDKYHGESSFDAEPGVGSTVTLTLQRPK
jgi:signal transduction histidine kinase